MEALFEFSSDTNLSHFIDVLEEKGVEYRLVRVPRAAYVPKCPPSVLEVGDEICVRRITGDDITLRELLDAEKK